MNKRMIFHMASSYTLKFKTAFVVFLLANAVFTSFAVAADSKSIATIVRVSNVATIINQAGETRTAEQRGMVYIGDEIHTSDDAWLTINFFDLTRIIIRPNTVLTLSRFPETLSTGDIIVDIKHGGARFTTGTLVTKYPNRFRLKTPYGDLFASRSEWVVRVCEGDHCVNAEDQLKQCSGFDPIAANGNQFISVYKGQVELDKCPSLHKLKEGETLIQGSSRGQCDVVPIIPCFVLFDSRLGRDKVRRFLPLLSPSTNEEGENSQRPNARDAQRGIRNRTVIPRSTGNQRN